MLDRVKNGRELGLGYWKKNAEVVALARDGRGIVMMPTGTGKTTQSPQGLHEAGFTREGQLIVTVPTRVLAAELSSRVAEEMNVNLGSLIGYQVRGEKVWSRQTRIIFMTEGMLRGIIRRNPRLNGISGILFDEFHKRTLMSDFNVALVERSQQEGWKGFFLLMSATVDPSKLAAHFNCGVVDGSELIRPFPVAKRFVGGVNGDLFRQAADQALMLAAQGQGNGIVFMPGKAEIENTIAAFAKAGLPPYITVLPLHSELDSEARHAPFATRRGVTITVATDIVETGATLPDVGFVVDSGLAREKTYDATSDVGGLKVVEVAKDRLEQRAGRSGRVRDGVCVRLFSQENYERRAAETVPEIFRVPLREVVLTIKALGLSREGQSIRLIDNPEKTNWKQAKSQLQSFGFVAAEKEAVITETGLKAVELGCDPREAAMLLKAAELGCLQEVAWAIAAKQTKPLFIRPRNNPHEAAEAQQAQFVFRTSSACDAWAIVQAIRKAEDRGDEPLGDWCKRHFVSYRAITEVFTTARQLLYDCRNVGLQANAQPATEVAFRKAIVAGLPDRVFRRSRGNWYEKTDNWSQEACLARESVIVPSRKSIVVWEVVEVPTRRGGTFRLITSACELPE